MRDDTELIARIKRRDPQAMGALYDRYGGIAYSLILRIVHENSAAEAILAETFVKAWNQIDGLVDQLQHRHAPDLGLWLLLLARNHAVEYLRPPGNWLADAPRTLPVPEQPSLVHQSARDRNAEQLRALREAFLNLDPKERQTLESACFEGLALNEIALKIEQPPAEVKQSIAAALAKLSAAVTTR